ncbi:hypothetical protein [Shewanella cyperi]|uniref:hypothetical protein n=1 Tax=Shewanella cyperi TaxID=2814292 RepID=UPI001A94B77C|nr:hypothetical protein [Shewanella cyperi]QSX40503.1 hypothetical protein JYB84_16350 [Shewanella cyperi]
MRPIWIFAAAAFSMQAHAGLEQQLGQCATIQDKLERLICYDKLAADVGKGTVTAETTKTIPAATATIPAQVAISPEASFGARKKAKDEVEKIYLEVAVIDKDKLGSLKIEFTNGQVWKQIEDKKFRLSVGEKVFIEKAALGSFLLGSDDRNATIRVKRLK